MMLGVILAQTGTVALARIQPHTSFSSSQSWPIAMPMRRSGMPCGQLKLISKPSTPVASQRSISCSHAARSYSSMIDAISTLHHVCDSQHSTAAGGRSQSTPVVSRRTISCFHAAQENPCVMRAIGLPVHDTSIPKKGV